MSAQPPRRLVLGTGNAHKVRELSAILGPLLPGVELLQNDGPSPEEDGETYAANALIKARAAHRRTGLPAVADDSGIEAVALGGEPGVRSARFAGTGRDEDNRRLLLERTRGAADRSASFVCAAVCVWDGGQLRAEARWPGTLLTAERGDGGFGYDPLFVPDGGDGRSAAELSAEEKDAVSHRGRAFRRLAELMQEAGVPAR